MFHCTNVAVALAAAALLTSSPLALAAGFPIDEARGGIPTLAPVLEKVTPGVVNISTESRVRGPNGLTRDPTFGQFFRFDPTERLRQGTGSGVIVDAAKGYIVTNHHVINGADGIKVTLWDGRQIDAKVIGSDADTDIAVVQVQADKLTAVPLGDPEKLRVGDFVVAIGNPFGLGQSVTSGIVSALGRGGLNLEGYEDFIQTDASINPGNSGGALVDATGRLIGINTAIIGPTGGNVGIGFAVPVNMAKAVMDQLISYGEVQHGRLGVSIADLNPALGKELGTDRTAGVAVVDVERGSAGDRAGLRKGDVITGVNGTKTPFAREVRNRIGLLRPGEKIELSILRDGRAQTLSATLEGDPLARRTENRVRAL